MGGGQEEYLKIARGKTVRALERGEREIVTKRSAGECNKREAYEKERKKKEKERERDEEEGEIEKGKDNM